MSKKLKEQMEQSWNGVLESKSFDDNWKEVLEVNNTIVEFGVEQSIIDMDKLVEDTDLHKELGGLIYEEGKAVGKMTRQVHTDGYVDGYTNGTNDGLLLGVLGTVGVYLYSKNHKEINGFVGKGFKKIKNKFSKKKVKEHKDVIIDRYEDVEDL